MVNGALFIAGSVGVVLTGIFLYFEVGRFAAPQVPRTLFDERKELLAYTAGLFGGIVLSLPLGLLFTSVKAGLLLAGLVGLLALVGGSALAQWLVVRSVYFGSGESTAFYVVGFRLGTAAILVLTVLTLTFGDPALDVLELAGALAASTAIVVLEGAGGLLAMPERPGAPGGGGTVGSLVLTGPGYFFLALGTLFGPLEIVVAALVLVSALRIYARLRERVLAGIRPPAGTGTPEGVGPSTGFGRTDR